MADGAEADRVEQARTGVPWKRWGPYLSERQWGTVREDYSDNGDAWSYFSHDQSRSRAYKWGEDGIAGFCDDHQRLCFAIALWNGVDPILKERMFGLTNSEGNHGEDVKEYYFYLDATPTSSYLKYRYRYPLGEFPYEDLVTTNRSRSRTELEYELLDTGIFDDDHHPPGALVRFRSCLQCDEDLVGLALLELMDDGLHPHYSRRPRKKWRSARASKHDSRWTWLSVSAKRRWNVEPTWASAAPLDR